MAAKNTKATAKDTTATTTTSKPDHGLSSNQVKILRAIAASKTPLTYGDVRTATGIQKGLTKLMAAQGKTHTHADSLQAKGLIECQEPQGDDVRATYAWTVTAAGRKLAKTLPAD